MANFLISLRDDHFKLLDPGAHFGGGAAQYHGMRSYQRVRNLILESPDDIVIPGHARKVTVGGRELQMMVPDQHVSRWRLISDGDLTVSFESTPAPTQARPNPEQVVQWAGRFEVSYYLSGGFLSASGGAVTVNFEGEVVLNATPSESGLLMAWFILSRTGRLVPESRTDPGSVPVSWQSGVPANTTAPEAIVRSYWATLAGTWGF